MKKNYFYLLIIFLSLFFIRTIFLFFQFHITYESSYQPKLYHVQILEKLTPKENWDVYRVKIVNTNHVFLLYLKDKSIAYTYGHVISINASLSIPKVSNNKYDFNYQNYLNSQYTIGTMFAEKAFYEYEMKNIVTVIMKQREKIIMKLESSLSPKASQLVQALLFGEKLESELKQEFSYLGLLHLVSISGFNIVLLLKLISFFFEKWLPKQLLEILKIVILSWYNIFCFFQIPLLRATLSYVVAKIFSRFSFKKSKVKQLLVVASFFLLYNPYVIFSVSFLFTFTATLGIILFRELFQSYFKRKYRTSIRIRRYIKNHKIYDYITSEVSLFLSVQLLLVPLQLYFFGSLSIASLFFGMLLTPIFSIQLVIIYLYSFIYFIPIISNIMLLITKGITTVILMLTKVFSFQSYAISIAKGSLLFVLLYFTFIYLIKYRSFLYYRYQKKVGKWIVIIVICLLLECCYNNYFISFVYYFDVGQGNMALVKRKNTAILIDCGSTTDGNIDGYLENFLKQYNITKLDAIVISHFHQDHVNALSKILEKVKVEYFLYTLPKKQIEMEQYRTLLEKHDVKELMIGGIEEIKIGDITLEIFSSKNNIVSKDSVNSNSMITLVSYASRNHLFLGDATKETEHIFLSSIQKKETFDKLRNLTSIQIGHHGSKTSTTELLLHNINTEVAVISAKKKKYGHPSKETITLLEKFKISYWMTEKNGGKWVN